MNTTPLWVPLAVAVFGLLGTVVGAISGVLITQRRSDKREAIAWEREQEREKARWAREDAARTFEYRRDAYISFYKANIEAAQLVSIYIHEMFRGDKDFPYPPIWVPEAEGWREAVQIYGTPTVKTLANKAQEDYRKMAAVFVTGQGITVTTASSRCSNKRTTGRCRSTSCCSRFARTWAYRRLARNCPLVTTQEPLHSEREAAARAVVSWTPSLVQLMSG